MEKYKTSLSYNTIIFLIKSRQEVNTFELIF
jgi:hypothetical protein